MMKISYKAPSNGSSSSLFPSALYAFSQPPLFLSHFVEEYGVGADYNPHQQRKHQKI
ncbi:hypothetical protein NC652_002192 [Populus alba x Populus x berolinensis]|nr:hypothetical protein NC652_002192 [Populus alba x Populus x berolinensis]